MAAEHGIAGVTVWRLLTDHTLHLFYGSLPPWCPEEKPCGTSSKKRTSCGEKQRAIFTRANQSEWRGEAVGDQISFRGCFV